MCIRITEHPARAASFARCGSSRRAEMSLMTSAPAARAASATGAATRVYRDGDLPIDAPQGSRSPVPPARSGLPCGYGQGSGARVDSGPTSMICGPLRDSSPAPAPRALLDG